MGVPDALNVLPPLSLYVHLPWCVSKCPYCDFNSFKAPAEVPENEYVDALLRDLELDLPHICGRPIETIFLGGGTPSLFAPESLSSLMEGLKGRLSLAANLEVTMEANPGTVDQGKFHEFRAIGVNRLSLGVQSFDDVMLQRLGRIHSGAAAVSALMSASAAGFDNVNVDLMWGLPHQVPAQAHADLERALSFAPRHLSYYQLTLEPNTRFHRSPPRLPDEDVLWAIHEQAHRMLAAAGYTQYEVSAFARRGGQCRHNRNYWEFGDYIGIGAGAHGKLTDPGSRRVRRTRKLSRPRQYIASLRSGGRVRTDQFVQRSELVFEFMLNALRLRDGFSFELFESRTGLTMQAITPALQQAQGDGLLNLCDRHVRPTDLGRRFVDDLVARFLVEAQADGKAN